MYYKLGYDEFKKLLFDIMAAAGTLPYSFETTAPEMVEMFLAECAPETYMLQMINLTGYNGMTFFESHEIKNIKVKFKEITPVLVEELTEQGLKATEYQDGMTFNLEKGELYKAFLIHV